jgi:hypothetical protein
MLIIDNLTAAKDKIIFDNEDRIIALTENAIKEFYKSDMEETRDKKPAMEVNPILFKGDMESVFGDYSEFPPTPPAMSADEEVTQNLVARQPSPLRLVLNENIPRRSLMQHKKLEEPLPILSGITKRAAIVPSGELACPRTCIKRTLRSPEMPQSPKISRIRESTILSVYPTPTKKFTKDPDFFQPLYDPKQMRITDMLSYQRPKHSVMTPETGLGFKTSWKAASRPSSAPRFHCYLPFGRNQIEFCLEDGFLNAYLLIRYLLTTNI